MNMLYVTNIALILAIFLIGGILLTPVSKTWVKQFPRAKVLGWILSALAWAWVTIELTLHPIDFLAFVQPYIWIIGIACIPLSWYALANLLTARAFGGLLMLYPMPLIIATRDQISMWRLVPISFSYLCLILGMVVVFYPWVMRVICEWLSKQDMSRKAVGGALILLALVMTIGIFSYGKVIGQ